MRRHKNMQSIYRSTNENKCSKEKANLFGKMYQSKILPKSFRLKPPIKSTKVYNIMQDCSKKLVVLAKNNVKQRMYSSSNKVEEIKLDLKNFLLGYNYIFFQNVTGNSREKEFLKKKKQLIDKSNTVF